jgi:rubredoxin
MERAAAEQAGGLPRFDLSSRCPRCRLPGDVEHHHLAGQRADPVHGRVMARECRACGHTWDEADPPS